MIQSMTGYGRGEGICDRIPFRVEIRSINHRYCDITVKLPEGLTRLEPKIRSAISSRFSRGKFEITISPVGFSADGLRPLLNIPVIARSQSILNELSNILKTSFYISKELSLSDILSLQDLVTFSGLDYNDSKIDEPLMRIVNKSLDELMEMRLKEGRILCKDIERRISRIESLIKGIERRMPSILRNLKRRYIARIEELSDKSKLDMDRLNQELAIMVDRMDVTEEVVRLKSHICQIKDKLTNGKVVGRSLDFLIQEVNREINTIASKALDVKVSQIAVDMKSEAERIREQVQNIE